MQIIVWLPAGPGTDILARTMSQACAAKFDKPFLAEDRPGAERLVKASGARLD